MGLLQEKLCDLNSVRRSALADLVAGNKHFDTVFLTAVTPGQPGTKSQDRNERAVNKPQP